MKRDSRHGTFASQITQEIFSCKVFLLILDERSNQSEHVQNEVGLAFRRFNEHQPITILPVRMDDCVLSYELLYYLNRFTIVNANPSEAQDIRNLLEEIADILGKAWSAPAETAPTEEPQPIEPTPTEEPQPVEPTPTEKELVPWSVYVIKRGKCGKNVTYTLDNTGLLTISGQGAMKNYGVKGTFFTYVNTPWRKEADKIFNVRIQSGVTSIGKWAFDGCKYLKSVTIPDSVTFIGNVAFADCALTSVTIPNSMTSIGRFAFARCALTSVMIPDSVTSIGAHAFEDNHSLKSASVPAKATVGRNAFPDTAIIIRRK